MRICHAACTARRHPIATICHLFFYWAVPECSSAHTTVGKALAGLRVVGDDGLNAPRRNILLRALFFASLFGVDSYSLLDELLGGRLPAAYAFVHVALGGGYLLASVVVARLSPASSLPHESWTRTRIARGPEELAEQSTTPRASTRLFNTIVAGVVALSLLVGILVSEGSLEQRLLALGDESGALALQNLISRRIGVRSEVSSSSSIHWATGKPSVRVFELEVSLPWGADSPDVVRSIERVITDTLTVDPRRFERLELTIGSSISGLLNTNRYTKWAWVADTSTGRWRRAPPAGEE